MKITWINPAPIVGADGDKTSTRVCVRLRSMLPGDELRRRGHDVEQVFFPELQSRLRDPHFLNRDAFVFGKAFFDFSTLIRVLRENGAKVLIDICDNVFAPPEDGLKEIYLAMLPMADAIVTSSELMAAALADKVGPRHQFFSIPDAVEGRRVEPEFAPRPGSIKLLWFGYPNNLPLLENELGNLNKLTNITDVRLTIVTVLPAGATLPAMINGIRIRYRQWSPQAMQQELKACDVVVIPSDDSPARITKSANRVITAIWGGKFVAAYPLPSYQAFQPFAHIDRDLAAGVMWALENRESVPERVLAGQRYVHENFAVPTIADAWKRALEFTTTMTGG